MAYYNNVLRFLKRIESGIGRAVAILVRRDYPDVGGPLSSVRPTVYSCPYYVASLGIVVTVRSKDHQVLIHPEILSMSGGHFVLFRRPIYRRL